MTEDTPTQQAQPKLRLRQRPARTKEQAAAARDKRKSDVLIAAQSLDNEIQSVKNLKRLSIGSLDLLIDPELEFRVNSNTPPPDLSSIKRKSWAAAPTATSPDSSASSILPDGDASTTDSESITNSSIDVTRAEYLHDEAALTTSETIASRASSASSFSNTQPTERPVPSALTRASAAEHGPARNMTTRNLSGISSLRRGSHNVTHSRRVLSGSAEVNDDDDDDGDAITNNLLWVPADQHPSVQPKNYIELVQDTLENIQIQDEGLPASSIDNKENIDSSSSSSESSSLLSPAANTPHKKKRFNRALVRRPSSLRKSYTELSSSSELTTEDEDSETQQHDRTALNRRNSKLRTASLKDITEELTKISNNAGLTNTDAITLARTLSMAGSFTSDELDEMEGGDASSGDGGATVHTSEKQHKSFLESGIISTSDRDSEQNTKGAKETLPAEEFASNMFMKNGLTIPQRSSLRRSKFNTYRIRSSDSSTSSKSTKRYSSERIPKATSEENHTGEQSSFQIPRSPLPFNSDSPATVGTTESPGSISDLYDHYTQLNKTPENDDEIDIDTTDASVPTSQDSSLISNDSVLFRPNNGNDSGSLLHESSNMVIGTAISTSTEAPKLSPTKKETQPWSGKLDDEVRKAEHKHEQTTLVDNSLNETAHIPKARSNHSKNRHKPILNMASASNSLNAGKHANTATRPALVNMTSSMNIQQQDESHKAVSKHTQKTEEKSHHQTTSHSEKEPVEHLLPATAVKHEHEEVQPKKYTLEEKLVKLFKRKTHRRKSSSSHGTSSNAKTSESGVQEEFKKKISKFRKNPKKQVTPPKPSTEELHPTESSKELLPAPNTNEIPKLQRDDSEISDHSHSSGNNELPALQPAVSVTSAKNRESPPQQSVVEVPEGDLSSTNFTETVRELDGDDSQDISGNSDSMDTSAQSVSVKPLGKRSVSATQNNDESGISQNDGSSNQAPLSSLPPRKLTFADVKHSTIPNAPIKFSDSAFGFPLPELTNSTVIMFDHRLGINVERAIYRLSHLKLSDSKRELRQQVLLSNFMYAYLNLVNHTLYMEQAAANTTADFDTYQSDELEMEDEDIGKQYSLGNRDLTSNMSDGIGGIQDNDPSGNILSGNVGQFEYTTEQNNSDGAIIIPEI
ncbi:Zds2 protein [Maudiozyma humilis]|uniref:Zds2 protein n=1 Tax=Maudiozyma humilis TaxID=51915 RepID=A0AAV5S473_MAUHU|nr:Zds2 protein [Kazachstania humilis]